MIQKPYKIVDLYASFYKVQDKKRFEDFINGFLEKKIFGIQKKLEKYLSFAANVDLRYSIWASHRFFIKETWEQIHPYRILIVDISISTNNIKRIIQKSNNFLDYLIIEVKNSVLPEHLSKLIELSLILHPNKIYVLLSNPTSKDIIRSINLCNQIGISILIEGFYDVESFIHWLRTSKINVYPYSLFFSKILLGLFKIRKNLKIFLTDMPFVFSYLAMNNFFEKACKTFVDFFCLISAEKLKEAILNFLKRMQNVQKFIQFIEKSYTPIDLNNHFVIHTTQEYVKYSSLKDFYEDNKIYPFVFVENFEEMNFQKCDIINLRSKILCLQDLAILISSKTIKNTIKQLDKYLAGLPVSLILYEEKFENVKFIMSLVQKFKFPLKIIGIKNISFEKLTKLMDFYYSKKYNMVSEIVPFSKVLEEESLNFVGLASKNLFLEKLYSELGCDYEKEKELCFQSLTKIPYITNSFNVF